MLDRNVLSESNGVSPGTNGNASVRKNGVAAAPAEEEDIALQEVLGVLYANKWWVLGVFALVLAAAAAYTALQTPEYRASSTVMVKSQSSSRQMTELLGLQGGRNNVANEVEILQSRAIASRVAGELLDQRYVPGTQRMLSVLKTEEARTLSQRDVTDRLQSYMQVQPAGPNLDLIEIAATSPMPEEAQLLANLYAEEYAAYDRASSSERARNSREFLAGVVANFQDSLQQQENQLQSFLQRERVVAPDAEAQQLYAQLSELKKQRYQAQMRGGSAQAKLRRLRSQLEDIRPGLAEEVSSNDALRFETFSRRAAQIQTELTERYAANPGLREDPESDPQTAQLVGQMEALREQARARAESLSEDALAGGGVDAGGSSGAGNTRSKLGRVQQLSEEILQNEIALQSSEASLDVIDGEIASTQAQLEDIPQNKIVKGRLERSLQTSSDVYATLQKRLYDARIAERSEMGKVNIIEEAIVPRIPVTPKPKMNLALGVVLGLLCGVGVALMRNMLDNKVRTPDGLRRRGQNVIGTVPDMRSVIESDFDGRDRVDVDGHQYETSLITLLNPLSPIAESYRRLRANVQFSRPDGEARVIMITSAEPGEGKSVTSSNLAVAMAQAGQRTLFIDADLRRSTGHRIFDVARDPGLVDWVFEPYEGQLDRYATDIENLHMLPAGSSVPNPAEVMGSKKMKELLKRARSEFDKVVVDTPPVLAVTDSLLVAKHCDVSLLVCSAGQTGWPALKRADEILQDAHVHSSGIVLNRFEPKANYGYGYGYGDEQYGMSLEEEEAAV